MLFIIVSCIFQTVTGSEWSSMASGLYTYMGLHPPTTINNSSKPLQSSSTGYCFPLKQSRYCGGQGGYGNYFMASLITARGDSVYDHSTLDSSLDSYFSIPKDSGNGITKTFGCQSWDPDLHLRFRFAYACHTLLNSAEAQLCNQNELTPMCPASCTDYVNDLISYTNNRTFCPNTTFSENTRQSLAQKCHSQAPSSEKNGCVYDVMTENEICGFQISDMHGNKHRHVSNESISRLCSHCQSSDRNNRCCQVPFVLEHCRDSDSKSQYIYMPMIAVVASLCALTVTAITYYIYWRKNKQQRRTTKIRIGQSEGILTTTINTTARNALYKVWRQKNVDVNMPQRRTSLAFSRKEDAKVNLPACKKERIMASNNQPPSSSPSVDKREESLRGYPYAELEEQHLTEPDVLNVVYSFAAVESDELTISIKDRVRLLRLFSDGWAFVQRVGDGMIGAVPAVCLQS